MRLAFDELTILFLFPRNTFLLLLIRNIPIHILSKESICADWSIIFRAFRGFLPTTTSDCIRNHLISLEKESSNIGEFEKLYRVVPFRLKIYILDFLRLNCFNWDITNCYGYFRYDITRKVFLIFRSLRFYDEAAHESPQEEDDYPNPDTFGLKTFRRAKDALENVPLKILYFKYSDFYWELDRTKDVPELIFPTLVRLFSNFQCLEHFWLDVGPFDVTIYFMKFEDNLKRTLRELTLEGKFDPHIPNRSALLGFDFQPDEVVERSTEMAQLKFKSLEDDFPNLVKFNFDYYMEPDPLIQFSVPVKRLRSLEIPLTIKIDPNELNPNLSTLKLYSCCDLSHDYMLSIVNLENLRNLSIDFEEKKHLIDTYLLEIFQKQSLRHLQIEEKFSWEERNQRALTNIISHNLRSLRISNSSTEDLGRMISNVVFSRLETLDIWRLHDVNEENPTELVFTGEHFPALTNLVMSSGQNFHLRLSVPTLKNFMVNMDSNSLNTNIVITQTEMHLDSFTYICRNEKMILTSEYIAFLRSLKPLKKLELNSMYFESDTLPELLSFTNVEKLVIGPYCSIRLNYVIDSQRRKMRELKVPENSILKELKFKDNGISWVLDNYADVMFVELFEKLKEMRCLEVVSINDFLNLDQELVDDIDVLLMDKKWDYPEFLNSIEDIISKSKGIADEFPSLRSVKFKLTVYGDSSAVEKKYCLFNRREVLEEYEGRKKRKKGGRFRIKNYYSRIKMAINGHHEFEKSSQKTKQLILKCNALFRKCVKMNRKKENKTVALSDENS